MFQGTTWSFLLPCAFLLDLILGDPRWVPHPIRWMGKAIEYLEPRFRRLRLTLLQSGLLFAVTLIAGTWLAASALIWLSGLLHPAAAIVLEVVMVYFALSTRSLESSAMAVHASLVGGDLPEAKSRVAMIVGRDVTELSDTGVARAAVETVAENLVDGVISPLFFAAIGGGPLAMAYKMVNTLDSMVGYKSPRYWEFGRAAAKIDDAANFLPARLSVPFIALAAQLLARNGKRALFTAMKEGEKHASPNAGFPEAAFAGALGVWLGGPNTYGGQVINKPVIGYRFGPTRPDHIRKACHCMVMAAIFWMIAVWIAALIFH
jgi:adenosylcobinamide-phosphate synthase